MPSDEKEPHPVVRQWLGQIEMLEMWDRLGVLTAKGREILAFLQREVREFPSNQT